jgi:uncharacterized protein YdcH (DUF465 family)
VHAVYPRHPGLRRLKDVIVFSTKGDSPLADKLSGGDYDGDKIWVCWDHRLTEPFANSPSLLEYKKWKKDDHFQPRNLGKSCLKNLCPDPLLPDFSDEFFDEFFRLGFASSFAESHLGSCTNLLEKYRYHNRVEVDKMVIHLANLCGVLVDAPKQGLQLKDEVVQMLRKEHGKCKEMPLYKDPKDRSPPAGDPESWDVLDRLVFEVGRNKVAQMKSEFQELKTAKAQYTDRHLTRLFRAIDEEKGRDESLKKVVAKLHDDLSSVWREWSQYRPDEAFNARVTRVFLRYQAIRPLSSECHNRRIRTWFSDADRPNSEWKLLKASALFRNSTGETTYPWWITMPELCYMKAHETSLELSRLQPRTVVDDVYLVLKPSAGLIRREDDEE